MATSFFMRRIASRQAVSRKVEGNEPRKRLNGKDDTVTRVEVNTGKAIKASNRLLLRSLRPWHV